MSSDETLKQAGYHIRPGTHEDIDGLGLVEKSAATSFKSVALSKVAEDPSVSKDVLSEICDAGNLKVSVLTSTNEVIAFIAGEVISITTTRAASGESNVEGKDKVEVVEISYYHIVELDTHVDHQQRGIGKALLQSAISECRERGMTGLALTTYRDVAFNGPFYHKLGFREEDPKNIGVKFEELVSQERMTMHEPGRRCFMTLKL